MIIKKKSYGGLVSIEKDSNIVYSNGPQTWGTIREGSLLKIQDEFVFYQIIKTETENFEFNFDKHESNKIVIKNDLKELNINDTISVLVREYELFSLTSIISKGQKYSQNDILEVDAPHAFLNVSDNLYNKASFKVVEVTSEGEIVKIRPVSKGRYLSNKMPNTVKLLGGSGSGAEISVEFEFSGKTLNFEKNIIKIEKSLSFSFLTFSDELDKTITEGVLTFSKAKMILGSNYLGESVLNAPYTIIRDFSPFYNFPLMALNTNDVETIFNNCVVKIDKKLKELEDKMSNIKN